MRAIADLRQRGLDVRGLLVGEGPFREELERLLVQLDLTGKVILAGYQSDILAHLVAMDVVVIPSQGRTVNGEARGHGSGSAGCGFRGRWAARGDRARSDRIPGAARRSRRRSAESAGSVDA